MDPSYLSIKPLSRRRIGDGVAHGSQLIGIGGVFGAFDVAIAPQAAFDPAWQAVIELDSHRCALATVQLPQSVVDAALEHAGLKDDIRRVPADLLPLFFEAIIVTLGDLEGGPAQRLTFVALAPVADQPHKNLSNFESFAESGLIISRNDSVFHASVQLSREAYHIIARSGKTRRPLNDLTVPIAMIRTTTRVTADELRRVTAGDVILIPDLTMVPSEMVAGLPGSVGWNLEHRTADNAWEIMERMAEIPSGQQPLAMEPSASGPPSEMPISPAPLAAASGLGHVPVDLSFQVTRITRSLAELESWRAGQLVTIPELTVDAAQRVSIVANGVVIGAGEIVLVGDGVGVQIRWIGSDGPQQS